MPAWLWREAFRVGMAPHEHRPWRLSLIGPMVPSLGRACRLVGSDGSVRRGPLQTTDHGASHSADTVGEIHHHMGVLHAIPHCDRLLLHVSLVLLFHPGIGHQRHRTTWQQSLSLLSHLPNAPVVAVTSLSAADQQHDLAELPGGCGLAPPLKWYFATIEPSCNLFASHSVGFDATSDPDHPDYQSNSYWMALMRRCDTLQRSTHTRRMNDDCR